MGKSIVLSSGGFCLRDVIQKPSREHYNSGIFYCSNVNSYSSALR